MKDSNRLAAILYFVAGIAYFISSIISRNYVSIPIGCCFVCLGVMHLNRSKNDSKNRRARDE